MRRLIILLIAMVLFSGADCDMDDIILDPEPIEPPIDIEPIIPDPPEEDPVPITDLPGDDFIEDPIEPPVDDPVNPPVKPPVNPPVDDPDVPPIDDPVDPPEDDNFCDILINSDDNNVNIGCQDNFGLHYDGCLGQQPIQYKCVENQCVKQELETCDPCSKCTYKDEKWHEKLAPDRTYYCAPNEFEKGAAAFTCLCPDPDNSGEYILQGAISNLDNDFYNDLVQSNCNDDWDNVCNSWREDHSCPTWDSYETEYDMCGCYGGSCQFASTWHVTCKIDMPPEMPELPECKECTVAKGLLCGGFSITEPDYYWDNQEFCDFCTDNCFFGIPIN